MKLKELLKGVEIVQIIGNEQVEITNITQDSRKIIENTLFSKFAFSYMPPVNGKSHDKPDDSRQKIYLPDD